MYRAEASIFRYKLHFTHTAGKGYIMYAQNIYGVLTEEAYCSYAKECGNNIMIQVKIFFCDIDTKWISGAFNFLLFTKKAIVLKSTK